MKEVKEWIRQLPERKKYIDVITAIMSVPILLTVMVTNISNLTPKKDANASTKTENKLSPTITEVIKIVPVEVHDNNTTNNEVESKPSPTPIDIIRTTVTPTSSPSCKKEVGPVSIISPVENESVSTDPTCIDISYKSGEYCGATWAYRIDGGSWSEYMDNSICIHNISNGAHKLELKVKSNSSADEKLLIRNFVYSGQNSVTTTVTATPTNSPTPTVPVSTSSATIN
jgi:hypothetical protein